MIQLGKEFKSLKSTYIFNEALIWCLKNAFQVELSDGSFKFVVDCPIAMWDKKVSDYLIRKKQSVNSQSSSIMDTLKRLWLGSDSIIIYERRRSQPFCNDCNVHGHSDRNCARIRARLNESDYIIAQHFIDG